MFKEMKKAVRTIYKNNWTLEEIWEAGNMASYDMESTFGRIPTEECWWAYRCLQWAGFIEGDVEPYAFPKAAFKYEKTLNRIVRKPHGDGDVDGDNFICPDHVMVIHGIDKVFTEVVRFPKA